jgi:hypothetical protein
MIKQKGFFDLRPQWFVAEPIFYTCNSRQIYPYSLFTCIVCGWNMSVMGVGRFWEFECNACGYFEKIKKK